MHLVKVKLPGYGLRRGLAVAGEHDRARDALCVKLRQRLLRAGLDHVLQADEADGPAAPGNVDARAVPVTDEAAQRHTVFLHQGRVAGEHDLAALRASLHAAPGDLALQRHRLRRDAARLRLPDGGLRQRMAAVALRAGDQREHVLLRKARRRVRMANAEVTRGQRAGLVQHERFHAAQRVQAVAALDQDAAARRRADARKVAQRHGDDQRARAGRDQERERAVHPDAPAAQDHGRHDGQHRRQADDDRRIHAGKHGDEALDGRLALLCLLHHRQNPADGGLRQRLGHARGDHAVARDEAREHRVARLRVARNALACQRGGVHLAHAGEHHRVQRHALAGADADLLADLYLRRVDRRIRAVPQDERLLRLDRQQRLDLLARAAHGVVLEALAHLVKQHDGAALVDFADRNRRQGGDGHQEILVQHAAPAHGAHRGAQHAEARDDITGEQQQRFRQRRNRQQHARRKERQRQNQARQLLLRFLIVAVVVAAAAAVVVVIVATAAALPVMMLVTAGMFVLMVMLVAAAAVMLLVMLVTAGAVLLVVIVLVLTHLSASFGIHRSTFH